MCPASYMLGGMDYRDRLLRWMREEEESLGRQIELFSSGKAEFRTAKEGKMVDATDEALREMMRRLAELQAFIAEFEGRLDA